MSDTITPSVETARYTVTHRGGCTLISGELPISDFARLTADGSADAILSPDLARLAGVRIAFGPQAAVDGLIAELSPAAEKAATQRYPELPEGAVRWLAKGEQGLSSAVMFRAFTGISLSVLDYERKDFHPTPMDPDDFRRCRLLTEAVPSFASRLGELNRLSPKWNALVNNWDELATIMDREAPEWRTKRGSAPATYERMKGLGL